MTQQLTPSLAEKLLPGELFTTWNGRTPATTIAMRAADLPGMQALPIRELVPWLPEPLWSADPAYGKTDLELVRKAARERVQAMDWSKIKARSRVNVLANPHGFFMAGESYVVMLEEIVAHIQQTRNARVKLCIAESMGHIENADWVKTYNLEERFEKVVEVPQCGAGVEVDTQLGKFWLMQPLFNADFFVHTHITEMREAYIHRMRDRLVKPFGMSYVRLETRSAYHFGYGPRTGQLISRLIFDSDFIQQRYAGSVVLDMTPEGVIGVEGDFDLLALDRRITERTLRNYGVVFGLLSEVDECVAILDSQYPSIYTYSGGVILNSLYYADVDYFDLDNLAAYNGPAAATRESGLVYGRNKAIKALVVNYMTGGLPQTPTLQKQPSYVVGKDMYSWVVNDPSNTYAEECITYSPDLPSAVAAACAQAGTDKLFAFDNTQGAFRVSESLAKLLLERAPKVREEVLNHRLPKWLAQRRPV
ncbi:hypothetical protein [Pseudomonas sp. PDM31]|uniref:hypothetical protein n=1 Tax=Pseudomonas sp. PDM31 TaxID=2854778 RepID=UPI001C4642EA|nr:hypothetical protein [Pseudomonas sp. PDM31]MBV7477606.1 hypothetical protein [Pseudomonas sp. PDM31]